MSDALITSDISGLWETLGEFIFSAFSNNAIIKLLTQFLVAEEFKYKWKWK